MLELRRLTKRFGATTALDGVDVNVARGEIVGLLGENGAGKSTLLSLVGGTLQPDDGRIYWGGAPLQLRSVRDATRAGIGVVHQHFKLVESFTVAENIALQAGSLPLFKPREWEERVRAWASSIGWTIDPARRIDELSVGEKQRVEICKALFAGGGNSGVRLLLLDEPTANLTPGEATNLFAVLRRLRDQGLGIVFVSHKLNEVLALCDRIVVLRHGGVVGERDPAQTSVNDLATLMVGRSIETPAVESSSPAGVRLRIDKLTHGKLKDLSLQVRGGEIVGLAGVDGNGQAEILDVLAGLASPGGGQVTVQNEEGTALRSRQSMSGIEASELTVIPPDRQQQGLILNFTLTENMALHPQLRAQCRRRFWFDWKRAKVRTRDLLGRFDVRTPPEGEAARAGQLSGGNQQKVVIARALSFGPRVVIAADPTRGLDIGATQFVHSQLRATARAGIAVLLVSSDLDEILSLSDRIGVLYEGRLLPEAGLLPHGAERTYLAELMGGGLVAGAQN